VRVLEVFNVEEMERIVRSEFRMFDMLVNLKDVTVRRPLGTSYRLRRVY